MAENKDRLIGYDAGGVLRRNCGIDPRAMDELIPRLESSRRELIDSDLRLFEQGDVPAEKQPLDAAFYELPELILGQYEANRAATVRPDTELGRILSAAHRIRESVDRVVVLGGVSCLGARALLEACCDPYFNELTRAQRGSRPRVAFAKNSLDNDSTVGLMRLLGHGRVPSCLEDRWAIVAISKSGTTMETAVAVRQFLPLLEAACQGDSQQVGSLVLPITGATGALSELAARELNCRDTFRIPDGVGSRFSVMSAAGLLPASLVGLNVVRLLQGARLMNRHFRSAVPRSNVVLQYAGVCHLVKQRGISIRVLRVWANCLESLGRWYEHLLSASLGQHESCVTPLTVVMTGNLHTRSHSHGMHAAASMLTSLRIDQWRWDPLPVGRGDNKGDSLNDVTGKTLPQLVDREIHAADQADCLAGRPTAEIRLPKADEFYLGQLLQMLMLATVVEARLMGVNPYGQP